jgi:tRNA A37 threonylcarbamoyladenosine modification protein TsaB
MVGCYENGVLIESIIQEGKTSDILLPILEKLLKKYDIERIIYARGPGSYMAIKITYVILKTIETIKGIELVGCSGFELNENKPIKAIGSLYFIKEKETIITKKLDTPVENEFKLVDTLEHLKVDGEATPDYIIPAV